MVRFEYAHASYPRLLVVGLDERITLRAYAHASYPRLLVVGLDERNTLHAEQAPGIRHAQKVVWMRGTWGETRDRQATDSFGNFEDVFSEPVAPATGEADWLLATACVIFAGSVVTPEKMAEDAIYILPTGFGKSVIFQLLT